MPRGFMDGLKGCVAYDKIYECALGNNILSADEDGADVFVLDVRYDGSLSVKEIQGFSILCSIRTAKGSYAEQYAREHKIDVEFI